MWIPNDLGHAIDGLPSVAQSPLLNLIRTALEAIMSRRAVTATQRQERAAKQISDAVTTQELSAEETTKALKKQTRATKEVSGQLQVLTQDLEAYARQNDARYEHVLEVLAKLGEFSSDTLLGAYRSQQLMQISQTYQLARACEMSHESVLEHLDTLVNLPTMSVRRDASVTLQHVKRLSAEQIRFDRQVASLYDAALDGAPVEERRRLERVVSSVSRIVQCANDSAAEPTILVLPALAALEPEFRKAFLEALERVTSTLDGAHQNNAIGQKGRSSRNDSRTSPRMLICADVLKSELNLDNNSARRLHRVLAPFSVICVQPRYDDATLRLETWSWLRGDLEPTAFAHAVTLPTEKSSLLDIHPEWLLASFASWLTVLLGSALSSMGFEGVTFLSILRPSRSAMAERMAYYAVAQQAVSGLRQAFGTRYGNLGLAEEGSSVNIESGERLDVDISEVLTAAGWEGHNFLVEGGDLWVTITKPFSNIAIVVVFPQEIQQPLCVRCWRVDRKEAQKSDLYRSEAITRRRASEIELKALDASFPEKLNRILE